jgi:hypothetical protein
MSGLCFSACSVVGGDDGVEEEDAGEPNVREITTFNLPGSGLNRSGMLSHVFRPMITAFCCCCCCCLLTSAALPLSDADADADADVVAAVEEEVADKEGEREGEGGKRFVTRAKYAISFRNPVQGSAPLRPMPICWVAATMRVSSGRAFAAVAAAAAAAVEWGEVDAAPIFVSCDLGFSSFFRDG